MAADHLDLYPDLGSLAACGGESGLGFPIAFNASTFGSFNVSICDMVSEHDPSEFDALKSTPYAVTIIILYVIVIFLGAVGNLLVVITVIRTRQMWTATNIFIANLAFADVFVCVFDLPASAYYQITDDWIFGRTLCHVIPAAFAVVVYASTLTLTLIATDRYFLIVYPLRRRLTERLAFVLLLVVALFAMALATPIGLYSSYTEIVYLHKTRRYCSEMWPDVRIRTAYTCATLALQYVIPLVIIAILYFRIFMRIRQRMRARQSRRTRTTKMMMAVVAVFAITWTPFHLYALIGELNYGAVKGRYYKFGDALLRVVAMSSSCINPILYGWMNENYKTAFLSIIHRNKIGRIQREDSDDTKRSIGAQPHSPKKPANKEVANGHAKQKDIQLGDVCKEKKKQSFFASHITSPLLNKASNQTDV